MYTKRANEKSMNHLSERKEIRTGRYTIICIVIVMSYVIVKLGEFRTKTIRGVRREKEKYYLNYQILVRWIKSKQKNGINYIEKRLVDMGYSSVAIYGMSDVGELLFDELYGTQVNVKYGIDQKSSMNSNKIEVLKPDDKLPMVDAIIVTPLLYFDEIRRQLSGAVSYPIISLEDIIS